MLYLKSSSMEKMLSFNVAESQLQAPILFHLWVRNVKRAPIKTYTWLEETYFLHQLGLGMEEVIRYLFEAQPSFADFENWIIAKALGIKTAEDVQAILEREKREREEDIPDVLGEEELNFLQNKGYIVLKNAVIPREV